MIDGFCVPDGLEKIARDSVLWAVSATQDRFGSTVGHFAPSMFEVRLDGPGYFGWADLVIAEGDVAVVVDLKTGEKRDYGTQMAALAIAAADKWFVDRVRVVLIFADQAEVVEWEYGPEELERARGEIGEIVAERRAARKGEVPPRRCDYCKWCGKRFTCPEYTSDVTAPVPMPPMGSGDEAATVAVHGFFPATLADPVRLGRFLNACLLVRTDYEDVARKKAREYIGAGTAVPGWGVQGREGAEVLKTEVLCRIVNKWGWSILVECGTVSVKKLLERGVEISADDVIRKPGTAALVQTKE